MIMRRAFVITLLCLSAVPGFGQDSLGLDHYRWGTPISVMQDPFALRPLEQRGPTSVYSSNLSMLGDAKLDDCQFEFVNGRFSGIAATTPGRDDSDKLLRWLQARFGPGENREPLGWQWFLDGVHVSFDVARAGEGWLYWYPVALQPAKEKR